MAETPTINVSLHKKTQIPTVSVTADQSQDIRALDVYYTQDGLKKPADKFWG
jgi:hypothetical protein